MTEAKRGLHALPAEVGSLLDGLPSAAPGTIVVRSEEGGCAAPAGDFRVRFGRDGGAVDVLVGAGDRRVSRLQGTLMCTGTEWWLRNEGRLPLRLPDEAMLLSGHEMPLGAGYTPVMVGAPGRPGHLLEIRVVGGTGAEPDRGPLRSTEMSDVYGLTEVERVVLVALAQRYLRQERYPQPVSWKQVAAELNAVAPERAWTPKAAEHIVGGVRARLARAHPPVAGIRRDDGVGDPVGGTLNHNLIVALLRAATLSPADLRLLGDEPVHS